MYLPLFPLKLVAFPGEALNLHIFEPRYQQLLKDVEEMGVNFGVCVYTDKLTGFGTEVSLEEVYHRYDDGRMDIKTRGRRVFQLTSFDNPAPDKLYAGGEVEFLSYDFQSTDRKQKEYAFYLKEMLYLLDHPVEIDAALINSFSFAHKVGLKLEEELELVQMSSELDRLDFLIGHFKRMIPAIKAAREAKEKIKLNGHFKHLDPLSF
ncbi:LON peptidase substrate-binding domain-containing protein [Algoriphagus namhaensis]